MNLAYYYYEHDEHTTALRENFSNIKELFLRKNIVNKSKQQLGSQRLRNDRSIPFSYFERSHVYQAGFEFPI